MDNFGRELNSMEKLALNTNGMEGTGEHFVLNGEEAHKTLHREKQMKFNQTVNEMEEKIDKHNKAIEEYAKNLSEDINGLEIMPMFQYALIKPFDNNPFQQLKITESGFIYDTGGFAPQTRSNETGEIEEAKQFVKVGTVIEVGHKCEFLRPGDVVMYNEVSEAMVPFYKMGFVVVAESRILAVVNSELTKRREEIKNGR